MWDGPYGNGVVPQAGARLARPVPAAAGARLRRHLLQPPVRPGHPDRGDHDGPRPRCPFGEGPVRRPLVVLRQADRGGRRRSPASSARRCSSTSRRTRCSTAGSRPTCSTPWTTEGMGCIVFTALAQGLLTDRYLDGVPEDSRAARSQSTLPGDHLDPNVLAHVRRLNEIAQGRGQKLAQMALQWALRDPRVTSAVIGASSVEQLDTNLDALAGPPFTDEELRGDRGGCRRLGDQPLGRPDGGLTRLSEARPCRPRDNGCKMSHDQVRLRLLRGQQGPEGPARRQGRQPGRDDQPGAAGAAGVHHQHRGVPRLPRLGRRTARTERCRTVCRTRSPSTSRRSRRRWASGSARPTTRCWCRCGRGRSSRCPG